MSDKVLDILSAVSRELMELDARAGVALVPAIADLIRGHEAEHPYLAAVVVHAEAEWMTCQCGEDTLEDPFVVTDETWEAAYADAPPASNPCLTCLETALGRDLCASDFAEVPERPSAQLRLRLDTPG